MIKSFILFFLLFITLSASTSARELKEWKAIYKVVKKRTKCQSPIKISFSPTELKLYIAGKEADWSPVPLEEINSQHFVRTNTNRRFYFIKNGKDENKAQFIITEQKTFKSKERKEELFFSFGKQHEKILHWGPCSFIEEVNTTNISERRTQG